MAAFTITWHEILCCLYILSTALNLRSLWRRDARDREVRTKLKDHAPLWLGTGFEGAPHWQVLCPRTDALHLVDWWSDDRPRCPACAAGVVLPQHITANFLAEHRRRRHEGLATHNRDASAKLLT